MQAQFFNEVRETHNECQNFTPDDLAQCMMFSRCPRSVLASLHAVLETVDESEATRRQRQQKRALGESAAGQRRLLSCDVPWLLAGLCPHT